MKPKKNKVSSSIKDNSNLYYYSEDEGLDHLTSYNGTPSASVFRMHFMSSASISSEKERPNSKSQPALRTHVVQIAGLPSTKSCLFLRRCVDNPTLTTEDFTTEDDEISQSKSEQKPRERIRETSKSCSTLRHVDESSKHMVDEDVPSEDLSTKEAPEQNAENHDISQSQGTVQILETSSVKSTTLRRRFSQSNNMAQISID